MYIKRYGILPFLSIIILAWNAVYYHPTQADFGFDPEYGKLRPGSIAYPFLKCSADLQNLE